MSSGRRKTAWWGTSLSAVTMGVDTTVKHTLFDSNQDTWDEAMTLVRMIGTIYWGIELATNAELALVAFWWGIGIEHPDLPASAYNARDDLEDEHWLYTGLGSLDRAAVALGAGNVAGVPLLTPGSQWFPGLHFDKFDTRVMRKLEVPNNIVLRVTVENQGTSDATNSSVTMAFRSLFKLP